MHKGFLIKNFKIEIKIWYINKLTTKKYMNKDALIYQ